MKAVYIVEAYYGQYDDWNWNILGIYTDPLEAEQAKDKYKAETDALKAEPEPYNDDVMHPTKDQIMAYADWYNRTNDAKRLNEVKVVEYPLNTFLK